MYRFIFFAILITWFPVEATASLAHIRPNSDGPYPNQLALSGVVPTDDSVTYDSNGQPNVYAELGITMDYPGNYFDVFLVGFQMDAVERVDFRIEFPLAFVIAKEFPGSVGFVENELETGIYDYQVNYGCPSTPEVWTELAYFRLFMVVVRPDDMICLSGPSAGGTPLLKSCGQEPMETSIMDVTFGCGSINQDPACRQLNIGAVSTQEQSFGALKADALSGP